MTDPAVATQAVFTRWATEVESAMEIPTEYPRATLGDVKNKPLWARVYIPYSESAQKSLDTGAGRGLYRHEQLFVAQMFFKTPGDRDAMEVLARAVASKFRSITVSGAVFRAPNIQFIGVASDDPSRYQVNITCPFYVDEAV